MTRQAYDESVLAIEEQRQHKRMESKPKRKAQQLGYALVPLAQLAWRNGARSIVSVH
jgi:hypothetical protein